MTAKFKMKPLGSLCQIKTGKKDVNEGNPNGKYPFFTCAREHTFSDGYSFEGEAILIAGNGDVGNVQFYSGQFEAYQRTYVLMDFNQVIPQYLFHILEGKLKLALVDQKLGNTMPYIKKGMLTDFLVPVPSIDEQRRIVAVLEKAFAGIATATANAQRNLTNARALFPTAVEEVLSRAVNCKTMTLEQAADEACSLSYGIVQPGEEMSEGLPIVRPTDLRQKFIGLASLKRIDPVLANSYRRTTLRGDDLLLCVRGTTGMISVATPELAGGNVTRGIVPIRFNSALLSQELGYFLLRSASAQEQVKAATYGTALMQINIRDLKKLKLRIPARGEQQAIASLLNAAQNAVEQLCLNYSTKLEKLANLKQSLLQKAFAGELT